MRRLWILLFAFVPICVVALFLWAAGKGSGSGVWLPENISVVGKDIDHLFWVIFAITGTVFLLVNGAFLWFLWKYGGEKDADHGKGVFTHGNHTLETVWTLIPAGILAFIAFYQFGAWQEAKFKSNAPDTRLHARVLGGQFEWRIRYPHPDVNATRNTPDEEIWRGGELEMVNELHVVQGQPTVLRLTSRDVLHSFYIPQARLKQDLVPGMPRQAMWFTLDTPGAYDIACAELCGWGHYKMKGRLFVHPDQADYDAWFAMAMAAQQAAGEEAENDTEAALAQWKQEFEARYQ